ncbi:HlyD family secretion protein [Bradyrhizobium genosp. P]|uniref:HlyD family secretion protein n=1 Tax=Bradyrhizobium genosp. P TaxID=83641 RepID=UPI003CF2282F
MTSAILFLVVAVGLYFYVPGFWQVSTDDAYVNAHVVSIVPKVAAYVSRLHVNDNSKVARDDLLIELDQRDFAVAVDMANADLKSAEANASNIEAQIKEQQAIVAESQSAVDGDQAVLDFAQQQLDRYKSLATTGSGTVERLQQAESDVGQRRATWQHDLAALDAARAHQAVLQTQLVQAKATIERQHAALAQARLSLSYTQIRATEGGSVANKTVEAGNYVQPGQTLFSIVPDTLYITANFKETQLADVRPGQRATIRVDAFPGLRLEGRVDSLQRGTGSQFALLPPENATGNFVKVVQRVPVKITFDDPGEALRWISPGMSVEAKIYTAEPPRWARVLD